ncbi:MAG: rRNA maturation RNase YbeY [bacterium]|nr:rRNA maturation RNase YbeY [bacterium]
MIFYVEQDAVCDFPFDLKSVGEQVAGYILEQEACPYEAAVGLLITDDKGIHEMNRKFRDMDKPTDVLSFPNLEYDRPGDFSSVEESFADCFEPDTGVLNLGDIVLSGERVFAQAGEYGHSVKREFAFLVAHSMLHLCGYDHMEPDEAEIMERKQEQALFALRITREEDTNA